MSAKSLTASSTMSFRYNIGLLFSLVWCIPFVSYMNVLTVRVGFRLIHWLDEVPTVISLHVTSLRARGVSCCR